MAEGAASSAQCAESVVIASGRQHRGDDAAGPLVAAALRRKTPPCRIIDTCDDSLSMLNAWDSAVLAIVVDAAVSGAPAGTIHRLDIAHKPLPRDLARCSSHGLGLAEAIELGRVLGRLPERLVVFAIEAAAFAAGTGPSPEIEAAVPIVVREILDELKRCRLSQGPDRDA